MRKKLIISVLLGLLGALSAIVFSAFASVFELQIPAYELVFWVVSASVAPAAMLFGREAWQLIERMFSRKTSHKLNVYCRPAKSTGALSSPLLC